MPKTKQTDKPRHVLGGEATARVFAKKKAKVREAIRAMREDLGLTWEMIGGAVNLSPQRASAIYRTHVNPTATKRTRRSAA